METGCHTGHLLGRTELDRIAHEPHRLGRGGNMNSFLRLVLLQDVVLERATELSRSRAVPAFSACRDVHGEEDRVPPALLIVIDVLIVARGRYRRTAPPRRRALSIGYSTPAHLSEGEIGSSESRPMQCGEVEGGGQSRLHPELDESRGTAGWFRSAVPNPANIRIVQSLDRYIDACGPRR